MSEYGRINPETGAFEIAPVNFTAPDGTTIMNFYLDENLIVQYGFKPVITPPEPETGSEEIAVPRYNDMGDQIVVHWEIISTAEPSDDEPEEWDDPVDYEGLDESDGQNPNE